MNRTLKIILTIVWTIFSPLLLGISLLLLLAGSFSRNGYNFLTICFVVILISTIIFFWYLALVNNKKKVIWIPTVSFIGITILTFIIVLVINIVDVNIPTMSDTIYLTNYSLDKEDNILVNLENPTYKMESDLLILDGATALYPVYAAFAKATYPKKAYNPYDSEVMCNTTTKAYENLIDGTADLIFVAGPSQAQLDKADSLGKTITFIPIGCEAFVFFVNKTNPINDINADDIRKIYNGEITNWKDLGGPNREIIAYQRPEGSGSQSSMVRFMGDVSLMEATLDNRITFMGGIIDQVASYKNYQTSIGYSFRFFSTQMVNNNEIKLLAINGIYPTIETIKNKQYPISNNFYAAYIEGNSNPNLDAFLDWILSEQGQYIIEETGYGSIN